MTRLFVVAAFCFAVVLALAPVQAAEPLKSGPQVGETLPGPFHPLNVTGPNADEKFCLYCKNGTNPVAMVFARDTSASLTTLIKKLDQATAKNKGCEMGSFVVFLGDEEEAMTKKLKEMAKKEKLENCVLSIDNPAGPKGYEVAKDADITVVLYTDRTVKANHSFKKGQMKDKDVERIVADLTKILPKDK